MERQRQPLVRRDRGAVLGTVATAVLLVLSCGIAPVALALAPRPGETVIVLTLRPDAAIPRPILGSNARILTASPQGHFVTVPDASRDLVADLYRNGATLVLAAAPLIGCLPRGTLSPSFRTERRP